MISIESMATTKYATQGGMSARSAQAMLSTALWSLHLREAQMGKRIEVKPGDRYGRLTVIREVEAINTPSGKVSRRVECKCACGAVVTPFLNNVRRKLTTSCGCVRSEVNRKHGDWGSTEYITWDGMLARCRNSEHESYQHYGGRGIKVCDRWLVYENFLSDMGRKPSKQHSIERIDNNSDYHPGNCKWATQAEQNRNTSRNLVLTFNGRSMCAADWGDLLGLPGCEISRRIRRGWTTQRALETPLGKRARPCRE